MAEARRAEQGEMTASAQASNADCEFCHIVNDRSLAHVLFESESVLAFPPLRPATPGHTLIIPKRHIEDFLHLELELAVPLMRAVNIVSHALGEVLSPHGMNLISSAGAAASQTVFHVHLHLVPRWKDDQIGDIWPATEEWNELEKENLSSLIRSAISVAERQ